MCGRGVDSNFGEWGRGEGERQIETAVQMCGRGVDSNCGEWGGGERQTMTAIHSQLFSRNNT